MQGFKKDSQGRLFMATHDVRSAIVTAFATLSTSDAPFTSLIVGDTDYFLDPIELTFSNSSSVGASVDLYSDGTIVKHIDLSSFGTVQLQFPAPLKQVTKNTPWLVDLNGTDLTGTTINVSGSLIKKTNN